MLEHSEATKAAAIAAGTPGPDGVGLGIAPETSAEAATGSLLEGIHECVAISFSDLSVWCFACDAYIKSPQSHLVVKALHEAKFGPIEQTLPPATETDAPSPAGPAAERAAPADIASGAGEDAADSDSSDDEPSAAVTAASKDAARLEELVEGIRDGRYRRIAVVAGAGLSVSAGIPDFRSSDGIFKNLDKLGIPSGTVSRPEELFSIDFFVTNPLPFYAAAPSLMCSDSIRPTPAHYFLRLLHNHGLLKRVYTQNIDGLEMEAGVPEARVMQCHGGWRAATCVACRKPVDMAVVRAAVEETKRAMSEAEVAGTGPAEPRALTPATVVVPRCPHCEVGLVKPDITFYGEGLPGEFFRVLNEDVLGGESAAGGDTAGVDEGVVDLVLVMGTSLRVAPVSLIPQELRRRGVKRVLLNMEAAGDIGELDTDVVCFGRLDDLAADVAERLGWKTELDELISAGRAAAGAVTA